MKMFDVVVDNGQEVISAVRQELSRLEVSNGVIVSVVGSVDECCLSNLSTKNSQVDVLHIYNEPLVLSGTGEVLNGKPHIHCVLSREGGSTLAGHLNWAKVKTWYVRVSVICE